MTSLLDLYGSFLGVITSCIVFLPMFNILEWRKRGTAAGFSSVQMVMPCLMKLCWLRFGLMTSNTLQIAMHSFSLCMNLIIIVSYAYYAPSVKNLSKQLAALFGTFGAIYLYVAMLEGEAANDAMGKFAAASQNLMVIGGLYQIKDIVDKKTTEYVPCQMVFGILFIVSQWTIYAVLKKNWYLAAGNIPGLIMNLTMLALYVIYPPITWRVPILGTQQEKKDE